MLGYHPLHVVFGHRHASSAAISQEDGTAYPVATPPQARAFRLTRTGPLSGQPLERCKVCQWWIISRTIEERRFGFPVRTMVWMSSQAGGGASFTGVGPWDFPPPSHHEAQFTPMASGIVVPERFQNYYQQRRLPLLPLFPGFVLSMLLYAVLIAVLIWMPGVLRRRHRLRLGLCLHCKYPVRAFAVCPECGKPTERTP